MAIETHFGASMNEDYGISIHFDTQRNMDKTIKSYKQTTKDIEDLRWESEYWAHRTINGERSIIRKQWDEKWLPIRDKLHIAALEHEESLIAMEGRNSSFQSWFAESAYRTLFRMCDDGVFEDTSLHREFECLVIGQEDTCYFDSWNRMMKVNDKPW